MWQQLKEIFGSQILEGIHTAHEVINITTDKGVLEIRRGDTVEDGRYEISLLQGKICTGGSYAHTQCPRKGQVVQHCDDGCMYPGA